MEPDIDKIEAYLSGAMTGAERQAFEAEVAASAELAREVDAVRLAREAVELSISDRLRAQFQEWGESPGAEAEPTGARVVQLAPRARLRRLLAIAAGVLLVLVGGSFWYANDQYAAGAIAMDYYQELPLDLSVRGDTDPLAAAVADLQAGNFEQADAYFRSISAGDDQYFDARYYLAHSLFQQQQYGEALEILETLENTGNINLRENAAWLQALCYLQSGQTEDAKFRSLLSGMIADNDHSYHEQAIKLDKRLSSFWYDLAN